MPCIQTIVSDLFEMLFRDMPNQTGNEFHYRDGFHNKFVVLMSVVMKSNIFTIVFINEGSGNDGAAKISADVFGNNLRITSEKRSVFQKKVSEFRINGKNTVAVLNIDDLKRHGSGAVDGIFGATGREESAVTAKGNKLESATTVTAIHCATKRRIAISDHAVNIFNDCRTGMESINISS